MLPLYLFCAPRNIPAQASWEFQQPSLKAWQPSSEKRSPLVAIEPLSFDKNQFTCIYSFHFTFKLIVLPETWKEWRQLNMNCTWESRVIFKVIGTNSCHSNTQHTMVLKYSSQITSFGKYKLKVSKTTAEQSVQGCIVPSAVFSTHMQLGTLDPGELIADESSFFLPHIHSLYMTESFLCVSRLFRG